MAEVSFLLKTATLEVKDLPALCHGEDSMNDLHNSPDLHLTASISLFNTSP
jgi:hypothetical protein